MSDPTEKPPEKANESPTYGEEPRFPPVLVGAWVVFAVWGSFYIVDKLIPAVQEWSRTP